MQWESVPPDNFPLIKAVGYAPLTEQKANSEEERMLMAMKASKLEAYKELAEQVYGQKVDYKVTMGQRDAPDMIR